MKTRFSLTLALLLAACSAGSAQEPQPIATEELAKATQLLLDANTRLGELPLKLELAADQAVGFKVGEVGAILIPDRRFKAEKGEREDRKNRRVVRPVAQLWTSKIAPLDQGRPVPNDKLRLVKVGDGSKELELAVFSLGLQRAGKKGLELVLLGKDGATVLRVPLTAEKSKGAAPLTMTARKTGDESGVLELRLLGRYQAEIPVGKRAE